MSFFRKFSHPILAICFFAIANAASDDDTYITPNAGPRVEDGADVFFNADLIVWEATQMGFSFAESERLVNDAGKGYIYYPKFQFDPGFQLGFGLNLGHDGWDTLVNYTWFHPQTKETSLVDDPQEPNLFESGFDLLLSSAKLYFLYQLDVIDFEIGRNYKISQDLTLRPFIGLKTAWNREFVRQYMTSFDDNLYIIKTRQRSFEVGGRGGMNMHYLINSNWSLFSNTAFSVLSNTCKNHTLTMYNPSVLDEETISDFSDKQVFIQPVAELTIGLQWDIWSDSQEYHLGVSAAYDFQYWNNNLYTRVPIIIDETPPSIKQNVLKSGDLSIQGFNLKFRFDF